MDDDTNVLQSIVNRLELDVNRIDQRLFDLHTEVSKSDGEFNGRVASLKGDIKALNTRVNHLEVEFKGMRSRLWAVVLGVIVELIMIFIHSVF